MNRGAVVLVVLLAACGSSGNGDGGQGPPPGPSPGPGTQNPCATALTGNEADVSTGDEILGTVAARIRDQGLQAVSIPDKGTLVDGNPRGRALEGLWLHRAAEERRQRALAPPVTAPAPADADVGDIAVLQDQGDLILPANIFDLRATGLRFTRSGGGYDVTKIDASFRTPLGSRIILTDDDSARRDVPFGFSFYGRTQSAAFVNSDGNVTFGEEDKASTERNVSRLLTGPPRVSPFLADLDPSSGGKVFVNTSSDQYTVTWCGVRGFDSTDGTTTQLTLLPDGTIELKYGDTVTLPDAVVGLSPGRTGDFTPVDLSRAPVSGTGAVGERFAGAGTLDTVALSKRFYASHSDSYDQILFWTDQRIIRDAFSYELTVSNDVRGLGIDLYDLSSEYGSPGRLRSVVVMDCVCKFPDNPKTKFLGENNTLSVMGQEVGHRWLAYLNFRDRNGQTSDALLGRDLAHWSFFFDSDASVMEGNDIEDLGGGQFRTVAAVERYSLLDQYAMGLIPPSRVPPFFYVEGATAVPSRERDSAPDVGVRITGTKREVLIEDVIAVNGARSPSSASAAKVHRQAFVYVVGRGRTAAPSQIDKVDTFRRAWETFFEEATDGRMTAVTELK